MRLAALAVLIGCTSPAAPPSKLPECFSDSVVVLLHQSVWAPSLIAVSCRRVP